MRAPSRLGAMRARAVSLMHDSFTAYSPNGLAPGPAGLEQPSYVTQGTTVGKIAAVSRDDTGTSQETVGGVGRRVPTATLHIPFSSFAPVGGERFIGWEFVLTTPGPNTAPELAGSRWLVVDSPAKSYATARRLDVVRLS